MVCVSFYSLAVSQRSIQSMWEKNNTERIPEIETNLRFLHNVSTVSSAANSKYKYVIKFVDWIFDLCLVPASIWSFSHCIERNQDSEWVVDFACTLLIAPVSARLPFELDAFGVFGQTIGRQWLMHLIH